MKQTGNSMEKYENEQFKVDEITKIEEYQHFKAEDFKSLDLFSLKNEEYKVEEIQKQSFVEDSKKETNQRKRVFCEYSLILFKVLTNQVFYFFYVF